MLGYLRRHLAAKLFLSYLVVIWIVLLVLSVAAEFALPGAFQRLLGIVSQALGGVPLKVEQELYLGFRRGVNEALILAGAGAFLAAVVISILLSRQVVVPVREMMAASRRIADGEYQERVAVPGDQARGGLDELARLAVSFNQMAQRLDQTEAMRRELIGDVAHELRTPLASIQGTMEGLIDGVLPAQAPTFQLVAREAGRLQRLVQDLEELSRVEAGAFELHLNPVSVAHLAQAVADRLGRQFEEKGVTLQLDIPADLPPLTCDESRVVQVLLNLVGNALHYTPAGGSVHLAAGLGHCPAAGRQAGVGASADSLCLSVADTGIGIAAEHLPFLFTRFYRVDKSRSRAGGGSGIGLTIARHLVEAHGGHVWAESPGPGRGSTFYVSLPLVPRSLV